MTATLLLCHKTTSANAPGAEQDWGEEGLKAMQSAWHLIQAWLLQALGKGLASDERHLLGGNAEDHLGTQHAPERGESQEGQSPERE